MTQLDVRAEEVWNTVWRRRVAYFWSLFATLLLVAFPIILSVNPDGACRSVFCFAAQPIAALGTVLPNVTGTWIDVFATNPGWFLVATLAIALGYWRGGGGLATRIKDRMRPAWYAFASLRPSGLGTLNQPPLPSSDRAIQDLRLSAGYKKFYKGLTRFVLPSLFIVAILYAATAITNQIGLAIAESVGWTCSPKGEAAATFRTAGFCNRTGISVERDVTYIVRVQMHETWRDQTIAADPNGIDPNEVTPAMTFAVPLRRHLAEPWYKLMLRVGSTGTDTYAPTWRKISPEGPVAGAFEATIKARSSGQLLVYVNDAVLFPVTKSCFYGNNHGTATVTLVRAGEQR
jgi:hypothetical protein